VKYGYLANTANGFDLQEKDRSMIFSKYVDRVKVAALASQRNEITEHFIYLKLSEREKEPANSKVLKRIAADELTHYEMWRGYTGRDVAPSILKIRFYTALSSVLGLTFCIKLMEKGEKNAQ
jgi:vacuolar iron transporter family protein